MYDDHLMKGRLFNFILIKSYPDLSYTHMYIYINILRTLKRDIVFGLDRTLSYLSLNWFHKAHALPKIF